MLNITVEEISAGINMARIGNSASFVFKNVVNENPSWQDFIDHINKEIHTPMDNPIQTGKPFNERLINGVMLKSLFYMDARVRDMEKFPKYPEVLEKLKNAIGKDVYPVSVFVNFVANEYNVPKHCDKRETLFWQCQGTTTFDHLASSDRDKVGRPENVKGTYVLSPGDLIYLGWEVPHNVFVTGPRAAITFDAFENNMKAHPYPGQEYSR